LVVGAVDLSCSQFKCQSTGHCIFSRYHCDGLINCFDASDELGCGMYCNAIFSFAVQLKQLQRHIELTTWVNTLLTLFREMMSLDYSSSEVLTFGRI